MPSDEIGFARADEPPLTADEATAAAEEQAPAVPDRVDLLLRPAPSSSSSELARAIGERLARDDPTPEARDATRRAAKLVYNEAYVACELTFRELIRAVLPLSRFWQECLWPGQTGTLRLKAEDRRTLIQCLGPDARRKQGVRKPDSPEPTGDATWLVGLVGRIALRDHEGPPTVKAIVDAAADILDGLEIGPQPEGVHLWTVGRNRTVQTSVWRSRIACKADAATTLFGLSCRAVRWAVIDSGIDARHPAFVDRELPDDGRPAAARSRIIGTWDFSDLRTRLLDEQAPPADDRPRRRETPAKRADRLAAQVARGRSVDWERLAPRLQMPHDDTYDKSAVPEDPHGTHVAGILVADWRKEDTPTSGDVDIVGMCPDMKVYDLRAFNAAGRSDEFQILSAMQFVRHLNAHADAPLVHGVNLSFSVQHDVDKYAAGGTPVCEEANRLCGSGVVVVAAAGNDGRGGYIVRDRPVDGYRTVSITDPGNAEKVITVGATHREQPHTYGVSYFSSRGPTGDGRAKPDLVAPGEKIWSTVPHGQLALKDGTSQACPHVSGACAMLLARHPELIGQPEVIKQILVDSCTDLGRERYFQGAGMVDVLRAIQAV